MRKAHRWIGLGAAVFLLVAALSGLLWAYAPYLYWRPDYLKPKHPETVGPPLAEAGLDVAEVLRRSAERLGAGAAPTAITLRAGLGRLLYEVRYREQGKERTLLLDARDGQPLSPLTPELAEAVARQHVRGRPPVAGVEKLASFLPRNGEPVGPVWRVSFATADHAAIVLDADSGRVLEEFDDARRFHFLVMRLHQLSFFGTRKTLTAIPGLALLGLIVSGVALWRRPRRSRSRDSQPPNAPADDEENGERAKRASVSI